MRAAAATAVAGIIHIKTAVSKMRLRVLGSAAGGGFPQWNCHCSNCDGVRSGKLRAQARTQSSVAVTADDKNWVLINASPDIRAQLEAFPPLRASETIRGCAIRGIVLVDGQIDHSTGLLFLREGERLQVYCTELVKGELTDQFPLLPLLDKYCGVQLKSIALDESFEVAGVPGLKFRVVNVESAAPPYSPLRKQTVAEATIGLLIEDVQSGGKLFYAPGIGAMTAETEAAFQEADCLLVDGTFWEESDMEVVGVGVKKAREMGHLPQCGKGGMLEALEKVPKARKVLIHINNTNPILDEESAQRKALADAGIEVAFDGMEINL